MRAGRKRKSTVTREKNGRAKRTYENPRAHVAAQPHRVVLLEQYREDPRAGTRFGRLMLNGKITPAQHEAGERYAVAVGSYRYVHGIPWPHPRAIDLSSVTGGGAEPDAEKIKIIISNYNLVFEALSEAGNWPTRVVNAYAVFDKPVVLDELPVLRIGLDKLVVHYGLDANLQIGHRHK